MMHKVHMECHPVMVYEETYQDMVRQDIEYGIYCMYTNQFPVNTLGLSAAEIGHFPNPSASIAVNHLELFWDDNNDAVMQIILVACNNGFTSNYDDLI